MNALVLVLPSVVLVAGSMQESITGTRGPISLETVVGAAIIIVVGMFLWYLRWQQKQETEDRSKQAATFEHALDRILAHDQSNHDQAMASLRELTQQQRLISERLSNHNKAG